VAGIAEGCRQAGAALVGGETAEMPGMYAPGAYDLAGFLVGGVARDRILDPASVREGDVLIGLPSNGLHTNGFSLARAIVSKRARSWNGWRSGTPRAMRRRAGRDRHRPCGRSAVDLPLAGHGGATLPYLAGRLDRCHEMIPACSEAIKDKPSRYLQRIWYDTVVYDQRALELCIAVAGSDERVLYGSDYPHNIGDMVGCLARVRALAPACAARIAGKNAELLFRL